MSRESYVGLMGLHRYSVNSGGRLMVEKTERLKDDIAKAKADKKEDA